MMEYEDSAQIEEIICLQSEGAGPADSKKLQNL